MAKELSDAERTNIDGMIQRARTAMREVKDYDQARIDRLCQALGWATANEKTFTRIAEMGVKESRRVLELMLDVKRRGLPIVLISHNMPHVFEVADRIHIHRLGKRIAVINPKDYSMSDAVAIMTGAMKPPVAMAA